MNRENVESRKLNICLKNCFKDFFEAHGFDIIYRKNIFFLAFQGSNLNCVMMLETRVVPIERFQREHSVAVIVVFKFALELAIGP